MTQTRLLTFSALCLLLSACSSSDPVDPPKPPPIEGDSFTTSQGNLIIQPINHATFVMAWADKMIYVDPVGGAEAFEGLPSPNLILVTDIHGDHMNVDTLTAISKLETVIVAPDVVENALPLAMQPAARVLSNGDTRTEEGVAIEAIPMYNISPDRLQYHAKGRGNGYVLTLGGKRVYIAGDTEDVPEMRQLRNIDIAFIPMNLPFTMTVEQAASAVREFKPKVVYPYHSRNSDVNKFAELVGTDVGVEVRLRNWY
jgi:L-ascorbate metabolism protein UlaG (beta-lactamase superfamily)